MGSRRFVKINGMKIGGGAPVRVESMLKSRLSDIEACIAELKSLGEAGCELVRVALPDQGSAPAFEELVKISVLPLMADIHFDYRLAVSALEIGCQAIRINPGNMSSAQGLERVVGAAKELGAVIRIGANGGSLNNAQLEKCGGDRGAALVLAVEEQLKAVTDRGFYDIVISAKSSSVLDTVKANAILAEKYDFPIHIGITEAGNGNSGIVKGAAGISLMLAQGIGDTIRVSLTAPGTDEVETGYNILNALGMRSCGWNLVSCPTCGRRRVEVAELVTRLKNILPPREKRGLTIAVMGCEVNGPKEAASADFGIAGSPDGFIVFKKGRFVCRGEMGNFENIVMREITNC